MGLKNTRVFFHSYDSAKMQDESVFLYDRKDDLLNNQLFLRHYINSGFNDLEVEIEDGMRLLEEACFVKDSEKQTVMILYTQDDAENNIELCAVRLVKNKNTIEIAKPIKLPFSTGGKVAFVRALVNNNIIYVCYIDTDTKNMVITTYNADTLEKTSAPYALGDELSDRYFIEAMAQQIVNVTLTANHSDGVLLQFADEHENLSVYAISRNDDSAIEALHLFDIDEVNIGYHSAYFDKKNDTLVTCYAVREGSLAGDHIWGVRNKIFSREPSRVSVFSSAIPLSSTPAIYFRPQITPSDNDNYVISWEGRHFIYLRQFSMGLNAVSPEFYIEERQPGNHKVVVHGSSYFVGYQESSPFPRYIGLSYKSTTMLEG